jgi:2-octaprenylphenol hydroxylase
VAAVPSGRTDRAAAVAGRPRVDRLDHDDRAAAELREIASGRVLARVTDASDHVLGELELASERAAFRLGRWHADAYCQPRSRWSGTRRTRSTRWRGQGANLGLLDAAALVEVLAGAVERDEDWSGLRDAAQVRALAAQRERGNARADRRSEPFLRQHERDDERAASLRVVGGRAAAVAAPLTDRACARDRR